MDKDTFVKVAPFDERLKLLMTDTEDLSSLWEDRAIEEVAPPSELADDASDAEVEAARQRESAYEAYRAEMDEAEKEGQRIREEVSRDLGEVDSCRAELVSYFRCVSPDDAAWQDRRWYAEPTSTREGCLEAVWDHLLAGDPSFANDLDAVVGDVEKQFAWIEKLAKRAGEALQAAQEAASAQVEAAGDPGDRAEDVPADVAAGRPLTTWNAEWGLFLRRGEGDDEYGLSTALSDGPGTDAPVGEPDGTWYKTHELAAGAREKVVMRRALEEIVSDPDIPLSKEEVAEALKTPGFKDMLDEARRELEAELGALNEG